MPNNSSVCDEVNNTPEESTSTASSQRVQKMLADLNGHVALLRQLLITIGQSRDSPEVREKIRRLRRQCVDACKHITQMLLPQIRSDVAAGIPVDKDHLVHFFCCTQLLARELRKSLQLIRSRPLDMSNYYDNRPGPSSLGGVLSQIILCKQLAPDFNQEEVCSIRKDSDEIQRLIDDMQEFMPMEETNGRAFALAGEDKFSLWARRRIKERQGNSLFSTSFRSFCCLCKPTYL